MKIVPILAIVGGVVTVIAGPVTWFFIGYVRYGIGVSECEREVFTIDWATGLPFMLPLMVIGCLLIQRGIWLHKRSRTGFARAKR